MRRFQIGLLIVLTAGVAFVIGRTTDDVVVRTLPLPSATVPSASPRATGAATRSGRQRQRILRYFATIDEANLPKQGILGGTMVAGTVAFPRGFEGPGDERFYVVGSDGHLLETWTYEIRANGSFRHVATHDGYAPVDFEDQPDDYDVYLWRPARYISADRHE